MPLRRTASRAHNLWRASTTTTPNFSALLAHSCSEHSRFKELETSHPREHTCRYRRRMKADRETAAWKIARAEAGSIHSVESRADLEASPRGSVRSRRIRSRRRNPSTRQPDPNVSARLRESTPRSAQPRSTIGRRARGPDRGRAAALVAQGTKATGSIGPVRARQRRAVSDLRIQAGRAKVEFELYFHNRINKKDFYSSMIV